MSPGTSDSGAAPRVPRMTKGLVRPKRYNALVDAITSSGISVNGQVDDQERQPILLVRVTSNLGGGGKYACKLLGDATSTPDVDSDLTEDDIGSIDSDESYVFFNLEEVGAVGTHVLTEDSQFPYAIGCIVNYTNEASPRPVVAGVSLLSYECANDDSSDDGSSDDDGDGGTP